MEIKYSDTRTVPEDRTAFENWLGNDQSLHPSNITSDEDMKVLLENVAQWWFTTGRKNVEEKLKNLKNKNNEETIKNIENSAYWQDLGIKDIQVRDYQEEIFKVAKKQNTICFLETGGGKTRIAIKLILERLKLMEKGINPQKCIVFLVPTTHLAEQQKKAIINLIPNLKVRKLIGENGIEEWQKHQWDIMFHEFLVCVMTPQILVTVLQHGYKEITDFDLLVFDECHHVKGKKGKIGHPYNVIMDQYHKCKKELKQLNKQECETDKKLPRILGLTASLLKTREKTRDKIFRKVWELEWHLDSKIVRVDRFQQELSNIVSKPSIIEINYISLKEKDVKQLNIPLIFAKEEKYDIYKRWIKSINRIALSMGYFSACISIRLLYKKLRDACQDSIIRQRALLKANPQKKEKENKNDNNNENDVDLAFENFDFESLITNQYERANQKLKDKEKTEQELLLEKKNRQRLLFSFLKFLNNNLSFFDDKISAKRYIKGTTMPDWSHNSQDIGMKLRKLIEFLDKTHNALEPQLQSSNQMALNQTVNVEMKNNSSEEKSIAIEMNEQQGIIFIEERFHCYVLKEILELRFNYLNFGIVTGHGTDFWGMTDKKQTHSIKRFREKKINYLLATDVAQEGMDIQSCNLVVMYSLPKTAKGFVQARGRARMKESKYALLIDVSDEQDNVNLQSYKQAEKDMIDAIVRRKESVTLDDVANSYLKQYDGSIYPMYRLDVDATGAFVSSVTASTMLAGYFQRLGISGFWSHSERRSTENDKLTLRLNGIDFDDITFYQMYVSEIIIHRRITNTAYYPCTKTRYINFGQTEKSAYGRCCVDVCRMLYKVGALNDNLIPIQIINERAKDKSKISTKLVLSDVQIESRNIPDVLMGPFSNVKVDDKKGDDGDNDGDNDGNDSDMDVVDVDPTESEGEGASTDDLLPRAKKRKLNSRLGGLGGSHQDKRKAKNAKVGYLYAIELNRDPNESPIGIITPKPISTDNIETIQFPIEIHTRLEAAMEEQLQSMGSMQKVLVNKVMPKVQFGDWIFSNVKLNKDKCQYSVYIDEDKWKKLMIFHQRCFELLDSVPRARYAKLLALKEKEEEINEQLSQMLDGQEFDITGDVALMNEKLLILGNHRGLSSHTLIKHNQNRQYFICPLVDNGQYSVDWDTIEKVYATTISSELNSLHQCWKAKDLKHSLIATHGKPLRQLTWEQMQQEREKRKQNDEQFQQAQQKKVNNNNIMNDDESIQEPDYNQILMENEMLDNDMVEELWISYGKHSKLTVNDVPPQIIDDKAKSKSKLPDLSDVDISLSMNSNSNPNEDSDSKMEKLDTNSSSNENENENANVGPNINDNMEEKCEEKMDPDDPDTEPEGGMRDIDDGDSSGDDSIADDEIDPVPPASPHPVGADVDDVNVLSNEEKQDAKSSAPSSFGSANSALDNHTLFSSKPDCNSTILECFEKFGVSLQPKDQAVLVTRRYCPRIRDTLCCHDSPENEKQDNKKNKQNKKNNKFNKNKKIQKKSKRKKKLYSFRDICHRGRFTPMSEAYPTGLSSKFWFQLLNMPSVLWRIENWLNVFDIDSKLQSFAGHEDISINSNVNNNKNMNENKDESESLSLNENSIRIEPQFIFEALCNEQAASGVSYQKLECLGDTVLKFWAVLNLFLQYPNASEGAISGKKHQLVSNQRLQEASSDKDINLAQYSILHKFRWEQWHPPFFWPRQNSLYFHLKIASKSSADIVESMLGACFWTHVKPYFGDDEKMNEQMIDQEAKRRETDANVQQYDVFNQQKVADGDINLSDMFDSSVVENKNDNININNIEIDKLEYSGVTNNVATALVQCFNLLHFFKIFESKLEISQYFEFECNVMVNSQSRNVLHQRLHGLCNLIGYDFGINLQDMHKDKAKYEMTCEVGYALGLEVVDFAGEHHTISLRKSDGNRQFVGCFERLEILGDAVLDILVTYFIYCQLRRCNWDVSRTAKKDQDIIDDDDDEKGKFVIMPNVSHFEEYMTEERKFWVNNKHLAFQVYETAIGQYICWPKHQTEGKKMKAFHQGCNDLLVKLIKDIGGMEEEKRNDNMEKDEKHNDIDDTVTEDGRVRCNNNNNNININNNNNNNMNDTMLADMLRFVPNKQARQTYMQHQIFEQEKEKKEKNQQGKKLSNKQRSLLKKRAVKLARQENALWTKMDPPKCMGDVFEALLGAIFLHCNWEQIIQYKEKKINTIEWNFLPSIQFCITFLGNPFWKEKLSDWETWGVSQDNNDDMVDVD